MLIFLKLMLYPLISYLLILSLMLKLQLLEIHYDALSQIRMIHLLPQYLQIIVYLLVISYDAFLLIINGGYINPNIAPPNGPKLL